jgi:catechol 2,3-dioxygenase-like lactoylglutathione lyase family enzyme
MDLGWLDVCLCVSDVAASRAFYEKLGFGLVEGDDAEGWAVVANGSARLGLFTRTFMGEDALSLNFRGGNISDIAQRLTDQGLEFNGKPKGASGSLRLRDPDGYLVFFDSHPGETRREP